MEAVMEKRAGNDDGKGDILAANDGLNHTTESLLEEMQAMKIKTLYGMVDELEIMSGNDVSTKKVLFLTNKQAMMFKKDTIWNLLSTLEIPRPNLVIFIRGCCYTPAELQNGGEESITRINWFVNLSVLYVEDGNGELKPFEAKNFKPGMKATLVAKDLNEGENKQDEREDKPQAKRSRRKYTSGCRVLYLVDDDGACVIFDEPFTTMDFESKFIGPSEESNMDLDYRIQLFVKEILMPRIVESNALVVCRGINNDTLSVAIGNEFAALQRQGRVNNSTHGHQPRLLCIADASTLIRSFLTVGTNAHGLRKASDAANSKNSFLTSEYLNGFGLNLEYWTQYDLIDGITGVILIDCKNSKTGVMNQKPHAYFENTLAGTFTGTVPSISIQIANPDDDNGIEALCDLIDRGAPVFLIDTRRRYVNLKTISPEEALTAYEEHCQSYWKQRALEAHAISTLAFFHSVLLNNSNRANINGDGESRQNNLSIAKAIDNLETISHSDKAPNVYISVQNQTIGSKLDFDEYISKILKIHSGNEYIQKSLRKDLFLREESVGVGSYDPSMFWVKSKVDDLMNMSSEQILEEVLDEGDSAFDTNQWLSYNTILKTAIESSNSRLSSSSGQTRNSHLVMSGSFYDLKGLEKKMEMALATVDRLPTANTLEELQVLREGWVDVDIYNHVGQEAKRFSKVSFIFLNLLGITSVVVATLIGQKYYFETEAEGNRIAFAIALLSSFTASYITYWNPVQKWQQLKAAALHIESEIWKFRSRTGFYSIKLKDNSPKDLLRLHIVTTRQSILSGGGVAESQFYKARKKSIYTRGQYFSNPTSKKSKVHAETAREGKKKTGARVTDNHHSPLGPSEYIELRLVPTMQFYQSRITPYYTSKTTFSILLMLSTILSAAFSSINLTVWISVVSVVASSITSWQEFSGTSKKLVRYAGAITKLQDLNLWWNSLTATEKASSAHVDSLILQTEAVIMSDRKAWLATSLANKSLQKAKENAQSS